MNHLFANICAVILSFNLSALTVPAEPSTIIYEWEADGDLEADPHASLSYVLDEFAAKGGTLLRMEGDTSPFLFAEGDVVFPACSGGNNRSQTLWGMLRTYADKISVMQPHATRYGFDPYNGRANWHRTHHVQKADEFVLWAGVYKSRKLGWDDFEAWLSKETGSAEELAMMLDYYNHHYYSPALADNTRRVYITFAKNAHAHLYRLNQTNTSLENVVVLFFPLEDLIARPLPEWDTHPRSVKAYTELSKLISKYLDFSQL